MSSPEGGFLPVEDSGAAAESTASQKLLVFGGSFDPPHQGHMNLLRGAVAAVQPDRVVVIPSGTAPHKHASATPGALRLAMCECFRPLFPGLAVSDMELRRPGKSYTVDTLAALQRENPGTQLYLCVGSDMLLGFELWHKWRAILDMAVLVAAGRLPGQDETLAAAAEGLRAQGGRVLFAHVPVVQASSSDIRAAVAAGSWGQVAALVPPPADAIVQENGLYRPAP